MLMGVPTTVTVKLQLLLLPLLSRAVLVTVVTPMGKAKPLAGTLVTLVSAQLSVAVTVKLHVLALPLLSRAVLVTVVTPMGKAKPLAGTLVTLVSAQLSLAVMV